MQSMLKRWYLLYSILQELEEMYFDVEQGTKTFQNRNLHFTSKKSLNSWWSVNTGGDGKGGPKSGTLSSENIFSLRREHCRVSWFFLKDHQHLDLKFLQLPMWCLRNTSTGGRHPLFFQNLGHHAAVLSALGQRSGLPGSFMVQPTKRRARSPTAVMTAKTTTCTHCTTGSILGILRHSIRWFSAACQSRAITFLPQTSLRLQEDKHFSPKASKLVSDRAGIPTQVYLPHSLSSFHNIMIAFNRLIFENKSINRQGCSLGRRVLWARSNISHLCPLWSTTTFQASPDPRVYCTEQHYTKQGTSLVIQRLRLHAPSAGAQVWSLVRALDPTCCN